MQLQYSLHSLYRGLSSFQSLSSRKELLADNSLTAQAELSLHCYPGKMTLIIYINSLEGEMANSWWVTAVTVVTVLFVDDLCSPVTS